MNKVLSNTANKNITRKEVTLMLRITVEHRSCHCIKVIEGDNVTQAFKHSNTDPKHWIVINIEEN